MDAFSKLLKPPTSFQGVQRQQAPLRNVTPLAAQRSFLQPPPSSSSIAAPPRSLIAHPLFQGISTDPIIVRFKRENPECVELIDYCLQRFGSKILEQYRPVFVEDLINEFKIRTNGRTPQQMIQLMKQPCFELELQSNFDGIQQIIREQGEELVGEMRDAFFRGRYQGIARTVIHGLDGVYHEEVLTENGIVTHPKTQRGTAKWSRAPCSVRMLHEDYLRLSSSDKKAVDDAYRQYGLQSETALETLGVEGGRRKTRRRRNKKQPKKVNVGKRSRKTSKRYT